jgi:uncharacterized membrane protein (DUF4010 family)
MELTELASRFAVALGIGLLVGVERGWRQRGQGAGARTAGIRTFSLTGILGGTCGALALGLGGGAAGAFVVAAGLAVYAATLVTFARMEAEAKENFSATTAVAGIATFALAACAMLGDLRIAAAAAVAMTGLLALREPLHGWVAEIAWPELRSMLILLAMTFIVLPLIPDRSLSPAIDINPREVWIIAIVLAAVSFAGYAAVKYLGTRHGILLSAAAGGLVSSTAVTLANARHAAQSNGAPSMLAAGVAIATAISFVRVVAIVAALKPDILWYAGPPLVVATLAAAGVAGLLAFHKRGGKDAQIVLRNPFQFWPVVGFAVFLGVIVLLGQLANQWFGAAGTFVGAAALGLADVDAITVSLARLVPDALGAREAAFGVLAAVATNTLSKLVIGAGIGGAAFARQVGLLALACYAGAGLALWLTLAMLAP